MCCLKFPKEREAIYLTLEKVYQKTSWITYFQKAQEKMIKVSTTIIAFSQVPSFVLQIVITLQQAVKPLKEEAKPNLLEIE